MNGGADGQDRSTAEDSGAAHVAEAYLPAPERQRQGLALCLSGGGFRAALLHLGVLRRLNELGILSRLDMLSTVSGGSIMGAHLLTVLRPWPDPGTSVPHWDERVARPFRAFTERNLRTWPMLKWLLLPWNWRNPSTAVEELGHRYEKGLTPLLLTDLPPRPRATLCATDLTYGVAWTFSRDAMGDYQLGMRSPGDWKVGRAVAASSCFPPVFDAMRVKLSDLTVSSHGAPPTPMGDTPSDVRLVDGGLYDNLGLEPVWKTAQIVLVSDGGGVFHHARSKNMLDRVLRYPDILNHQVGALRKRWLMASFVGGQMRGAYWGIGSAPAHYQPGAIGYPPDLVADIIAPVRTDMDAFTEGEMAVLENHGYCLAEAAVAAHLSDLPMPGSAPFTIPYPDWMDAGRVQSALKDSGKRTLLGRGWKWRI